MRLQGGWPFVSGTALETVTVESLAQVGARAFWGAGKALKGTVIINEGSTYIGNHAFKDCGNVENIIMPSTITRIDHNVFNGCKGLKSLSINMTAEDFSSVTKGGNWNTGVPVDITYLKVATE